jgi:hypothetical protein
MPFRCHERQSLCFTAHLPNGAGALRFAIDLLTDWPSIRSDIRDAISDGSIREAEHILAAIEEKGLKALQRKRKSVKSSNGGSVSHLELRDELRDRGVIVGYGTVWRFIAREDITFKKKRARGRARAA